MTNSPNSTGRRGTVFYDGSCSICLGLVERWGETFRRRGYEFETLQDAIASERYPLATEEFEREMKLLTVDGRWLGGADALLELWAAVPWLRPLAWMGRLPGLNQLAHVCYRTIAARRHCKAKTCP